jgi:hypothetical protein
VIDIERLKRQEIVNKLIDYICNYDKYPMLNFRGLIDVLGILYKRFKEDIKFNNEELIINTLILFTFPSTKNLPSEQSCAIRQILTDKLIGKSTLNALKEFCLGNRNYAYMTTQSFIVNLLE